MHFFLLASFLLTLTILVCSQDGQESVDAVNKSSLVTTENRIGAGSSLESTTNSSYVGRRSLEEAGRTRQTVSTVDHVPVPIDVVGSMGFNTGNIRFLDEDFPWKEEDYVTYVRIAVGMTLGHHDYMTVPETQGNGPDLRLFEEDGTFIGATFSPLTIVEGDWRDFQVSQKHTNYAASKIQKPAYTLFTANGNSICMTYALETWADTSKYGFVGNWGKICDKPWYPCDMYDYIDGVGLNCLWLDPKPPGTTGLGVHFPTFNNRGRGGMEVRLNPDYYCNNKGILDWRTDPDPHIIHYWKNAPENFRKRSPPLQRRSYSESANHTRLVKSTRDYHNATEVCESTSSWGPDFLSHTEGKFCDMDTKTLWPICTGAKEQDCFDTEVDKLRMTKSKRGVIPRSYGIVTNWG